MRWIRIGSRQRLLVAERRAVYTVDICTHLLKFLLEEKLIRDINSFVVYANRIGATLRDLTGPISSTSCVCFARQKVMIMLAHKQSRLVDGIRRRGSAVVVDDRQRGAAVSAHAAAVRGVAQADRQRLVAFSIAVFIDQHRERLAGLARAERQGTRGQRVVRPLQGTGVASC